MLPREEACAARRRGDARLPGLRLTADPRAWALAVAAGALLYSAHPPLDVAAAGPVAVVPLLALARRVAATGRGSRSAFLYGLVAGAVFFLPLLGWIARFGVVAWLLLGALQAAFIGLFVALLVAWRGWPLRGPVAVVLWVALEAARTRWPLGGFGWGVLGYSQHDGGPLLGVARLVGVLGVSAACVVIAAAVEALWARRHEGRPLLGAAPAVAALLLVAGVAALGTAARVRPVAATLDVAAVQGNDRETDVPAGPARVADERIENVLDRMVAATRPLAADPPAVTIWPENSVDADPRTDAEIAARLEEGLQLLDGAPLLAGMLLDGPREGTFYNAMVEVIGGGRIDEVYRKRKLVPFGEYIPARAWFGGLFALEQQIPRDGVAGDEPGVFEVAGARIGTIICFESTVPELAASQVARGAELLVVSTNNASFGRTPASAQHLTFSQLRAVETGRWVVHAGISGISALVDPDGAVTQRTGLFEQAIVRAEVPLVRDTPPAVAWAQRFETAALALGAVLVAAVAARHVRRRPTAGHTGDAAAADPTAAAAHAPVV